jgi:hypothetical protein
MMWRVRPDHEENAGAGKGKPSVLSHRTRVVAYSQSGRYLMSALQPIADQSLVLLQVRKVPFATVLRRSKLFRDYHYPLVS